MRQLVKLSFLIGAFLVSKQAKAYPDFIGYGYSSCITCHYNGLGGGALNDYGRALFATEITARHVYPASMDEEAIGNASGFLITKQMPWFVRAGIKYRGLYFQQNPNSGDEVNKWINMQRDFNLNFFFDKKQNFALITTTSYADYPPYPNIQQWGTFEKEFYLRYKQNNNLWWYAGQMDKAYGIRNADHSAVNRFPYQDVHLDQFGQSLGVIAHLTYPLWDLAINPFFGNVYDAADLKQQGVAITGEYQIYEKFKIGGSLLSSESQASRWKLAALTSRIGLSKGSSLMGEFGLKQLTNKSSNTAAKTGSYAWVESLVAITRGYNLLTEVELSKDDIEHSSPEALRYSIGAMMFPLPRTELRVGFTNAKTNTDGQGTPDVWTFQSQVHVSY